MWAKKNGEERRPTVEALADAQRKKSYEEYKHLRRVQKEKLSEVDRPLPPGKTEAEHRALAESVREKHVAGFEREKARLKALVDADATVDGRPKTIVSILDKLRRKPDKYPDAEHLQDTTGLRVIARDTASVREHVQRIKEKYEIVEGGEEDFITNPQATGYRGVHLTVKSEDGLAMEIQIRTPNQHAWSEWAHDTYKPQTAAQQEIALRPETGEYARAMSEWFARQDEGLDPGPRPRASWRIQMIFKTP